MDGSLRLAVAALLLGCSGDFTVGRDTGVPLEDGGAPDGRASEDAAFADSGVSMDGATPPDTGTDQGAVFDDCESPQLLTLARLEDDTFIQRVSLAGSTPSLCPRIGPLPPGAEDVAAFEGGFVVAGTETVDFVDVEGTRFASHDAAAVRPSRAGDTIAAFSFGERLQIAGVSWYTARIFRYPLEGDAVEIRLGSIGSLDAVASIGTGSLLGVSQRRAVRFNPLTGAIEQDFPAALPQPLTNLHALDGDPPRIAGTDTLNVYYGTLGEEPDVARVDDVCSREQEAVPDPTSASRLFVLCGGVEIVRYDTATGERQTVVSATPEEPDLSLIGLGVRP